MDSRAGSIGMGPTVSSIREATEMQKLTVFSEGLFGSGYTSGSVLMMMSSTTSHSGRKQIRKRTSSSGTCTRASAPRCLVEVSLSKG